jgi:DegV family protein with EDD domain
VPAVAVVTDSTSYLPRDLVAARRINEVSLYVSDGGTQRRELDISDYARFYADLRAATGVPTTSQPSIGDFTAAYEPLVTAGRDVVSIHISGGISGTVESARQAAAEVAARHDGRRIEVVDSTVSAGALGLVALAAAIRAEAGVDADAVVAAANDAIAAMRFWFAVDTLEYLRRGGRIGRARAWAGNLLHVKPILTIDREVIPLKRVRGNQKAMQTFVGEFRSHSEDGPTLKVGIAHADAPQRAEQLRSRVRGERPQADIEVVTTLGAVVGTHAGPGTVGFFWFDDRE